MSATERRRAWRRGPWAERLGAFRQARSGYRVVARRRRTPAGEIDLIARRGSTLAIVEVKARQDAAAAAEAVTARQRARILDATRWYLAGRPDLASLCVRFDAMLVAPWRWPQHLPDAWRPEC